MICISSVKSEMILSFFVRCSSISRRSFLIKSSRSASFCLSRAISLILVSRVGVFAYVFKFANLFSHGVILRVHLSLHYVIDSGRAKGVYRGVLLLRSRYVLQCILNRLLSPPLHIRQKERQCSTRAFQTGQSTKRNIFERRES